MSKDPFANAVNDVPEEQRRLLDRMMELGLVTRFGWNDSTRKWVIQYTDRGRSFLDLVKAVTAPEPGRRPARLLALDALAEGVVVISGFAQE